MKDDRLCESWFDFNDANIKPVMTSQIEESFGSASASEVACMIKFWCFSKFRYVGLSKALENIR